MTSKRTSSLSRLIAAEVAEAERLHNYKLSPEDSMLLVETVATLLVRSIDKFVRGAKQHHTTLIDRVTFDDVLTELIDGIFYTKALMKRITITMQQSTLTHYDHTTHPTD